jgi:hypothetical protein
MAVIPPLWCNSSVILARKWKHCCAIALIRDWPALIFSNATLTAKGVLGGILQPGTITTGKVEKFAPGISVTSFKPTSDGVTYIADKRFACSNS